MKFRRTTHAIGSTPNLPDLQAFASAIRADNYGLRVEWQKKDGDDPITEPARLCMFYRIEGQDGNDDLLEEESAFFTNTAMLCKELSKRVGDLYAHVRDLQVLQVQVFFYSVAESFCKSHASHGRLSENAYSAGSRQYWVSPMRTLGHVDLDPSQFASHTETIFELLIRVSASTEDPTIFDLLVESSKT